MKRKSVAAIFAILVLMPLIVINVWAMSSPNYRLDWYVLLSGNGGGKSNSPSYAVDFTIGQTAAGASSSPNYTAGLGYWYGVDNQYAIYLPVTLRNF